MTIRRMWRGKDFGPAMRAPFHRILTWGFLLVAGVLATGAEASGLVAARAAVRRIMQRGDVPGISVAVARGGEVIWAEGFGLADVGNKIPVTADTRFGLGSVSKCLTTALVARLVAAGQLEWDRPVEEYMPEFPHRGRGITLRLLASHRSGLGDSFDAANRETMRHYPRCADVVGEISRAPLLFEPGSRTEYSTMAYTVIGAVVERVTGLPFDRAMAAHVLRPLGLDGIEPCDPRATGPRRTRFHVEGEGGRIKEAPPYDPSYKLPGAGYVATAADIVRFASELSAPGFLPEEQLRQIFAARSDQTGAETPFGLGWAVGARAGFGYSWIIGPDEPAHDIVHHPGGGIGISCWLVLDRDDDLAVVVLSNLTGAPVGGRSFDEIMAAFTPDGSK